MSAVTRYLIFAIEHYRNAKGLTGPEVADLFERHQLARLIEDNYYLYLIESPDHMVAELDERIAASGQELSVP